MTYAAGQTILDDEYNTFVTGSASGSPLEVTTTNNVNAIWGTGGFTNGSLGYKQSGLLSPVAAGATISATQWASLLNRISTIASHQNSSITAITNPTTGDTIEALAALSTNIDTIWANRNNAAAFGSNITTGGSVNYSTAWGGAGQNQNLDLRHTITFASEAAKDAFFNCGGLITHTCSRSGGTASNKNTAWTAAATAMGTGNWKGRGASSTLAGSAYTGFTKTGGSGTNTTYLTGSGVQNVAIGASFTTFHKMFAATSPYTASSITRYLRCNTETTIDIWCRFTDDANANTDESADGTFNSTIILKQPSTTYLSNTWGTPTISSSAVTF
jgi:hypothetical protein